MAGIEISDIEIIKDNDIKATYSIAHLIQYEGLDEHVTGDFIWGFTDESTAILISSMIVEKTGLASLKNIDDTTSDIKSEFLNTIVGHTITEWDQKGLNIRFKPPVMVKNNNKRCVTLDQGKSRKK